MLAGTLDRRDLARECHDPFVVAKIHVNDEIIISDRHSPLVLRLCLPAYSGTRIQDGYEGDRQELGKNHRKSRIIIGIRFIDCSSGIQHLNIRVIFGLHRQ